MDFKLDIGELTNTIRDYENTIKTLAEQKGNINKTIAELTEAGWSGAAKDKFEQNHVKKQESYTKLEENFKYVENAMEREEKPEAVKLKKRCAGFEECIKRSAGGAALTHDDIGIISLEYSGQAQINKNVDECVNNHLKKMDSKFVEIQNLVNSLTFTSFPIGEDIEKARKSLKDQTTSLTDFNDSFNKYCSGVRTLESNICSAFSKISGITEGISKFRGMHIISENGQVDKNKVMQLMLKNPESLTNEEKEILAYVEKVLGEDEYAKLMNLAGMNTSASVVYIVDPKTGEVIDLSHIDKDTLQRINYLMNKLNSLGVNDVSKDDGSIMFWKKYSRQYFADKLANIISNITSGNYDKWQNFKDNCERRVLLCLDGALEIWGGYTEAELGYGIAAGGSVLTDGLATPVAVPVGGTLMVDGGNNMIEGGEKVYDSFFNTNWSKYNLLRDQVFKRISPKNGKNYYNKFSLTCGITCLAGDWKTLEPSLKTGFKVATTEDVVKGVPRTQHIKLAEKLNLPTEKVTEQKVNQVIFDEIRKTTKATKIDKVKVPLITTVDTIQVVDKTTKTPMVLYRTVNKNLSTSDWFIDFTNKYRKDIFSTGVDIRSTKGTYNSVFSSKNQDNKEESK